MREGLLTVVSPRVYRLKSNHYAVRGFSGKHGELLALSKAQPDKYEGLLSKALAALLVSEITKRPIESYA